MDQRHISVKEAVEIALAYYRQFGNLLPNENLRLEETVADQQGNWSITLSASEPHPLGAIMGTKRNFKSFDIDSKTGEVLGMRVRVLESAA